MSSKPALPSLTFITVLIAFACGCAPKSNLKPFEYLGQKAGEETAQLARNQGSVMAIWERFEAMPNPNTEAQVTGFKTAIAKSKGITLKEGKEFVRAVSDDPRMWPAGQVGRFISLAEGTDVAVLFVTLPMMLAPEEITALKNSKTKFIIVGGQSPMLDALIKQKAVQAAIVNRIPAKPAPGGAETAVQWFDRVYMVVKPM
ncbi:MAG: hypothetical protein RLZZ265_1949 [Verrucomicrobiota bacterium]|jgi:hypothetical protein